MITNHNTFPIVILAKACLYENKDRNLPKRKKILWVFPLLKIEGIIWIDEIVEKNASKHHIVVDEVEEILYNYPQIRFLEKGKRRNEDVYIALGTTNAGRYLAVLFI